MAPLPVEVLVQPLVQAALPARASQVLPTLVLFQFLVQPRLQVPLAASALSVPDASPLEAVLRVPAGLIASPPVAPAALFSPLLEAPPPVPGGAGPVPSGAEAAPLRIPPPPLLVIAHLFLLL